jgi:hypothetical protein
MTAICHILLIYDVSCCSQQCIVCKIDKHLINVEAGSSRDGDKLSIESVKVELACLYYLQLPSEKRSEGRHLRWNITCY